jgi:hypothetical protein
LKKFIRNIMFINSSVFFSLILLVLSLIYEYCSCKLLLSSLFLKFKHGEGSTISTNSEVFHLKNKLGERKHKYVQKQMERMLGSPYFVNLR